MAKKLSSSPLSETDLAGAQAIVDTYHELLAYVEACSHCGLDMAPILEQGKAYRDFAQSVIDQFGSGSGKSA